MTTKARRAPQTTAPATKVGVIAPAQPTPARETHRWLLLVHKLPAKPSNLRVRTWRRLQQIGAIPVKQAVYLLPDSPSAREDFEWLKTEIEAAHGQATMFAGDTVDNWSSDELIEEFRRAREADYRVLAHAVEQALKAIRRTRGPRRSRRAATRITETFRQRLTALEAIDFFGSAGRDRVAVLIADLQQAFSTGASGSVDGNSSKGGPHESYVGRTWVTRPRPGIDRMGSAWLIKRFIDREARFGFVEQPPSTRDAVPFDMFGVEFTHRGEWCTFETLAHTFDVSDATVHRLATIVHDIDLKDSRFSAPEAGAVGAIVDGLQALYSDDHTLLEQGIMVFEAMYRSFERAERPPRPRPVARRRRNAPPKSNRR
jgi:hypothetical protein